MPPAPSGHSRDSAMHSVMQWASVSATHDSLPEAVAQAADRLLEALSGREPDLVLVFASASFATHFAALPGLLRREFDNAQLYGCLGVGVIGNARELEQQPALALIGAVLPEVQLHGVHLEHQQVPPIYAERSLWDSTLHHAGHTPECLLLLTDPHSFVTEPLLKGLDRHFPQAMKLGGLASGMEQPGLPCLLLNDRTYSSGALCLGMSWQPAG
ncbi:MAG: FIST N-terminal domain-containing protein [Paludibacter sp.]